MRVLVVDDEVDIQWIVQAALDDDEVLTASDAPSALALLGGADVDVVLLDVMMPGMDGFALLRRLREDASTVALPVVMLTAKAGERDHVDAYRMGADGYLTKPFDLDELEAVVARVTTSTPEQRVAARAGELSRAQLLEQIEHTFGGV